LTFVDSSGQTGPLYGQAFDGLWSAYFGSTVGDGGASISQTLSTNVGQDYLLTFRLANDNAGLPPTNSFIVTVDNIPAYSFINLADQPYVAYELMFEASSNEPPLTFFGSNENSYFELDDVAVTSVPEPAALMLFSAGALMTLFALRRRLRGESRSSSC
jgi:PEP-CTERM motif